MNRFIAVAFLLIVGCHVPNKVQKEASRPNVIIIFTDDQGYQDVGVFGSPLISTPNLDQMAQDGIRFTDFYSASPVCSPSRAALLTGAYPTRVGVPKVLWPNMPEGLSAQEWTIADMLQAQGYATACVGKWHLGDKPQYLPTNQGFDSYYGIPFSNDMSTTHKAKVAADVLLREGMTLDSIREVKWRASKVPLMKQDEIIEYPVDQSTLTKRYTEYAIDFITENKDEPFFLYLAHTMPHIPLYASEAFKGKSARGLYGDVIEEIDWSVGEILKTLETLGITESTLVVYTSDNGPWNLKNGHGGSALPLRGYKFQTYEGGMRVPMIAQWKGKIPPNAVCREVASTIDFLPTIAHLTDGKLSDQPIDGENIWKLLSGEKVKSPHEEGFYYYKDTVAEAIRVKDWKLRVEKDNVALFDLSADISESSNVAEDNPGLVEKLRKKLEAFDKDLKQNQHQYD